MRRGQRTHANTVSPRLQVLDVLCHALVARRRIQREGLKTRGRNHIHFFCADLLQEEPHSHDTIVFIVGWDHPDGSRWSFAAAEIEIDCEFDLRTQKLLSVQTPRQAGSSTAPGAGRRRATCMYN